MKRHHLKRFSIILLGLLVLSVGAVIAQEPLPEKEWTVLIYINGNSEPILQKYNEESINELATAGSDDKVNFIVQVSRADDNGKAERILVRKGRRRILRRLGKTNMGSPQNLDSFIQWGVRKYPAKRYMVILKGHGIAHLGVMKDMLTKSRIQLADLGRIFKNVREKAGRKIDVLGLDSCHMACVELAYQVKDDVKYLVASQEISYAPNWEYEKIAKVIKQSLNAKNPVKFAAVGTAKSAANKWLTTVSVIDCTKMDVFTEKAKAFIRALQATRTPKFVIKKAFADAQHFSQKKYWPEHPNEDYYYMLEMRDLPSILSEITLNKVIEDEQLIKTAKELQDFIKKQLVVFERHSDVHALSHSHGLSIYAPVKDVKDHIDGYNKNLSWGRKSGWSAVIKEYGQNEDKD